MSTVQEAPHRAPLASPDGIDPSLYAITAEDFLRMLEAEVFPDEARVELWDGQVVEKMAKSIPHAYSSARAMYTLIRATPDGWCVWPENPVHLSQERVPLPGFALLRGSLDRYSTREATARDVGLIVELSDSTLRYDSTKKLVGYAQAGIPAYWVVNLVDHFILVSEQPVAAEGRYEVTRTIALGQGVPLRLDGVLVNEIPAVDLLPIRA